MRRRVPIGVVALALIVGGTLVVTSTVERSPGINEQLRASAVPLSGPNAPVADALPGTIAVAVDGCEVGLIDLSSAELQPAARSGPCQTSRSFTVGSEQQPADSDASGRALPVVVGALTLDEPEVAAALGDGDSLLGVVGYDLTDTGLAGVVVAARGPTGLTQVVQIWKEAGLQRSVELTRVGLDSVRLAGDFGLSGRLVRLSPDGRELAIVSKPGVSRVTLIDLATGVRQLLVPRLGLDWSPDGRWFAVSTGDQILVYGASRTEHVYALSVEAETIDWRPASERP